MSLTTMQRGSPWRHLSYLGAGDSWRDRQGDLAARPSQAIGIAATPFFDSLESLVCLPQTTHARVNA